MDVKVHIMVLTATASIALKKSHTLLGMTSSYLILLSPDKKNLRFAVRKVGESTNVFLNTFSMNYKGQGPFCAKSDNIL